MDLTFDSRVLMAPNSLMHRLSAERSPPTDLLLPEVHRLLVFPATELEIITIEPLLRARTHTPPSCHQPFIRPLGAVGCLQKPRTTD